MKKITLIITVIFFLYKPSFSQIDDGVYIEKPTTIFKFAPRILSPRFMFEKVLSHKSSIILDTRIYAWWLPQAISFEPAYRLYFNEDAPFGPYVNFKGAFGYFDYAIVGYETRGMQIGGGVSFGGQYKLGRKKAVVDIFGGIQLVAPFYLNVDNNSPNSLNNTFEYNVLHYILLAFPLEFGIRFGFYKTQKTPNNSYDSSPKNKNFNF